MDATITGPDDDGDIWSVSLKQGWNIIYWIPSANGSSYQMTTESQNNMSWQFHII